MSMNKSSLLLVNVLIVAMAMGQLCASSVLQLEQETAPSGLAICLNAEAYPESIEYKIKCLSSLMDEFYNSLNARQFKKAHSLVRAMNKFESLHPDIKDSSEIQSSVEQIDGRVGLLTSGKIKRRTFFVGK